MTTVVNNPAPATDSGGGFLIAILVLLVVGAGFFYFGIPAIRRIGSVQPQINIPNKIDINVNKTP